jgi:hypothetical protein
MPVQRWVESAAGGTSQRLKPGLAMMRRLSRKPGTDITFAACILCAFLFEHERLFSSDRGVLATTVRQSTHRCLFVTLALLRLKSAPQATRHAGRVWFGKPG